MRLFPIYDQKGTPPLGGWWIAGLLLLFYFSFLHFLPHLQIGSRVEWNNRKALENLHQTGMFGIVLAFLPLYFDLLTLSGKSDWKHMRREELCQNTLVRMGKAKGRRKCR
ncbi:hypothetical protein J3459_010152 [Metarhizium acridum]|uniref:uncharacterized protein n=1 Tax=Metarhizium acridum TaxID=92637 RepID=UPI001C6C803C|nr:hypothetical protein J3459_010152 [Metarhizium acridum]KAG8424932.1 hypothetical protein J3458_001686 [Metarhizium acridum]